jgi:two-component system, OmpR family, phosphate regulon sensor histidine kinase PhoR
MIGLMPRRLSHFVRSRIAIKLTLTLVGFVALTMAVAGIYLNHALEKFAVESLQARLVVAGRLLHDEARVLVVGAATPSQVRAFVTRAAAPTQSRVTLIVPDGRVLGDSDVEPRDLDRLENHRDRPEVREALQGRIGHDLRTSVSVSAPLLYVAVPVVDGGGRVVGVLRTALPLAAVTSSYAALHRVMLAGAFVALAVALGIGLFVARRVTRPVVQMQAIARRMSEGHFDVRAPVGSVDEIGALGRALNVMLARLREKIGDLEHERARSNAILDGMVEGVIAVDGHDSIIRMNERARAMLGVGTGRGELKPFLEVVRNADLHEIFRECRAAAEGVPVRRELILRYPMPRRIQVNAVPLRLAGEETGAVMVLHDVTELRRLEAVRTEFIANVSHELRTPLTAIQGYLETLLTGALEEPEHARRFLEVAFRHTERLGRLLNDLTDLSNIELGKVTLRAAPVRLEDVIHSALAIVQPRADSGEVTLETDLVPASIIVYADHDRLAQILINLVDNAVKYTRAGGRVTVLARALNTGRVEVAVADTGIGIPHADLPRITERFYRVDKARSRELGGTGLGLAIVKHLVAAHGGELSIESEVERGTTVRFTVPASAAAVPSQLLLPMRSSEAGPHPLA